MDPNSKIMRRFDETEQELFDKFFGGIISRDITIDDMLKEYYEGIDGYYGK